MRAIQIFNKIKRWFSTPFKVMVERDTRRFSFYNKDIATNETIYSAISMLSGAIASAPISLNKDYEKVNPIDHTLAELFEFGPNGYQSMFEFIRLMETLRNIKGAAYAIKEYGYAGQIERLWVLDNDFVEPILERYSRELYYRIRYEGEENYVHSSHIIDVHGMTTDGYTPISPLNVLRNTIDYDTEVKEFSVDQMKNGLKANIVIKLSSSLNDKALETYNEMINRFKQNGILYVDNGKEFQELKNSSFIDPNIAAVEKITIERVERVYGLIGKLTTTSQEKDGEDLLYLKDTILPIARMYEQELSKKLLTYPERIKGYKIKLNLNGFMRANAKDRGDFYSIMIRNGIFSPNDVLELEDKKPYEGGDVHYVSRDLCPTDQIRDLISSGSNTNTTNLDKKT